MRPKLTYANVMATIAVFVALGGSSFAVAALSGSEKKVVKKIAKKESDKRITARAPGLAVNHAKTADSAPPSGPAGGDLTGGYPNPSIGPGKVTSSMLGNGAVTAGKLALTHYEESVSVANNSTEFLSVLCAPDEKVTGGGAVWPGPVNATQAASIHLVETGPTEESGAEGWEAQGYNASGESRSMRVTVFCVKTQ